LGFSTTASAESTGKSDEIDVEDTSKDKRDGDSDEIGGPDKGSSFMDRDVEHVDKTEGNPKEDENGSENGLPDQAPDDEVEKVG
jgi:hypothetical protein